MTNTGAWRKSSHSGRDECVEVAWRTSSYSAEYNCVEVAAGDRVGVRDSRRPDPALAVSAREWAALLGAVRAGEM